MTTALSMSELADSFLTGQSLASTGATEDFAPQGQHAEMSAGGMLRQAREAAGLHIAALAVSLKVPVKKLEALEADQFDLLPDAVFVRALASSVCRTLKIDVAPVLERLPQTSRPKLMYQGVGINTPFRAPGDGPRPSVWAQLSRPAVFGGIVLLLGALVLMFLPALNTGVGEVRSARKDAELSPAVVAMPQVATSDIAKRDTFNVDSGASAMTQTTAMSSSPVAGASTTFATAAALPVVPAPSAAAIPASSQLLVVPGGAAAANPIAALPPTGIVVFSAKGDSWVEVTDAKGLVVLRRTLSAGEVVGASGTLPLAAIVGRADATQVQVRGKVFDMSAFAKDNVARFEVK